MSEKKFATESDFQDSVIKYIAYCKNNNEFPNIAGFCVFNDMHRDTYYAQKEYYSDTFKKVEMILENGAINSDAVNDTFKIFYMKNKCGYKDKQEIENSGDVNIKIEGYNANYAK